MDLHLSIAQLAAQHLTATLTLALRVCPFTKHSTTGEENIHDTYRKNERNKLPPTNRSKKEEVGINEKRDTLPHRSASPLPTGRERASDRKKEQEK
jgi:hypothetical protein